MNAAAIIERAAADGVVVALLPGGKLKIRTTTGQETIDRWRPVLRQHKAEIIKLLSGESGGAIEATRPAPASPSTTSSTTNPEVRSTTSSNIDPEVRKSATTPQPRTGGHLRVADKKVLPQQTPLSATFPPPTAAAPEIPIEVEGLRCGGCGRTSYKRVANGYQFPDGTVADGWHCGGEHCHVKLLSGNKAVDKRQRTTA